MFHTSRTRRLAACLAAGVLALLVLPATAAGGAATETECLLDQQYLPSTADAVDGWYLSCRGSL